MAVSKGSHFYFKATVKLLETFHLDFHPIFEYLNLYKEEMILTKKTIFKRILPVVIGGLLGYSYYYYIGCNNGCPIQSNPFASTIYGAAIGGILSFPSKKSKSNS